MEQLRLAPLTLLAGLACGVATVAVYQWTPWLVLAVVVTVLVVVAAPPGWGTRLPFALGEVVAVGAASLPRGEGDYLITSTVAGYTVLTLAFVVLVVAVGTLPRPGRARRRAPRGAPDGPAPDDQTGRDTPPG